MTEPTNDGPTVVRSFPLVDPNTGSNRLIANTIATCVRLAHANNPNSWVITQYEGAPTLIVGNLDVAVSGWFSGGYGLTVCREDATGEQLGIIEAHKNKPVFEFKSQSWATYLRLPNDEHLAARLALLAPAVSKAVERLAAMKATNQARLHDENMRHVVEVLTGTWLPKPGYWSEPGQRDV